MENAAVSFISGVQIMPIEGKRGVMDINDIISHIRPDWYHYPETTLICIENTHNRSSGTIYPLNEIQKVSELAREYGIKTHLDGARIFNAIVETGISLAEYSKYFDSVSFCFSKGLGAPVGSVICGDNKFIEKARRYRKVLGGGMRQAGILAAAAIYALENNIMRLKEDHRNARLFAEEISKLDYIDIDLSAVQTNIVMFSVKEHALEFRSYLESKGVLTVSDGHIFRAVFHLDVSFDDTLHVIDIFKSYKNGISVK
jgi:threonine aldolase